LELKRAMRLSHRTLAMRFIMLLPCATDFEGMSITTNAGAEFI